MRQIKKNPFLKKNDIVLEFYDVNIAIWVLPVTVSSTLWLLFVQVKYHLIFIIFSNMLYNSLQFVMSKFKAALFGK